MVARGGVLFFLVVAVACGGQASDNGGDRQSDDSSDGDDSSEEPAECDAECPPRSTCVAGTCVCEDGLTNCGDHCGPVNTWYECGECNRPCPTDTDCDAGVCVPSCPFAGEPFCDGF